MKNIARIAKAALHKCPGKSGLNVNYAFPVCLGRPVITMVFFYFSHEYVPCNKIDKFKSQESVG